MGWVQWWLPLAVLLGEVESTQPVATAPLEPKGATKVDTTPATVDPNDSLILAVSAPALDEVSAAKQVRAAIEKGASPTKTSDKTKATPLEIALIQRRPMVLQALFEAPSPISAKALEEFVEANPGHRRQVEKFRTKVARNVFAISKHAENRSDDSGSKMLEVISEAKILSFAEDYLNSLSMMIVYTMIVLVLVLLLYQLRIKQVPHPEVLLTPREEDTLWVLVRMVLSTLTTSIPTSNWFEVLGYGLALVGGVVWSEIFTNRSDLSLCLVLISIIQSLLTLSCYLNYAPLIDPLELSYSRTVHKLMYYPKKSDWNRAVIRCSYYIVACTLTFYLFFFALDPVRQMFDCPTKSISDTYGFEFSLTRTVAVMWDMLVFFSFALRSFRVMDTFIAFDLVKRMLISDRKQEDLDTNA
jgi:hypothetical protein